MPEQKQPIEQCTVCGTVEHLNPDCEACVSATKAKIRFMREGYRTWMSDGMRLEQFLFGGPVVNDGRYWR